MEDVYDCRKIIMFDHTRKGKAKVRTTPMEEKTLESESSTRHGGMDKQSYQKMFQRFRDPMGTMQIRNDKKHSIERLKSLGVTNFEESTDPTDTKTWLNILERCFKVMNCLEEKKVKLATFVLQKEVEGWWFSTKGRRRDTNTMN